MISTLYSILAGVLCVGAGFLTSYLIPQKTWWKYILCSVAAGVVAQMFIVFRKKFMNNSDPPAD